LRKKTEWEDQMVQERDVKFTLRSQSLPSSREEKEIAAASETGEETRRRNKEYRTRYTKYGKGIRNTAMEYATRQTNREWGI